MEIKIRPMTIEDYDEVYALWMTIKGFGIRSIDDSREGTERFLNGIPPQVLWRKQTVSWWGQFYAAMMAEPDVFTMCV